MLFPNWTRKSKLSKIRKQTDEMGEFALAANQILGNIALVAGKCHFCLFKCLVFHFCVRTYSI